MIPTLDELEALYEKATQGEWRECGADRGGCCGAIWAIEADNPVATTNIASHKEGVDNCPAYKDDAALIVALHNAFPSLLAELKALRAVAEAARNLTLDLCSHPLSVNAAISADDLARVLGALSALTQAKKEGER